MIYRLHKKLLGESFGARSIAAQLSQQKSRCLSPSGNDHFRKSKSGKAKSNRSPLGRDAGKKTPAPLPEALGRSDLSRKMTEP